MEHTTYVLESTDEGIWELPLAGKDEEALDKAKNYMDKIIKMEGVCVIDLADVWTLFGEKGTVFVGCADMPDETHLKKAVENLFVQLQKEIATEVNNVLIYIQGDITFLNAAESTEAIQGSLGVDANIVFGIFESDGQEGVEVMLAVV